MRSEVDIAQCLDDLWTHQLSLNME